MWRSETHWVRREGGTVCLCLEAELSMHLLRGSIGLRVLTQCVFGRAVIVNTLMHETIVAKINAIQYFNAVNAALFTSSVRSAVSQTGETETIAKRDFWIWK